jgi:hypothetical protein
MMDVGWKGCHAALNLCGSEVEQQVSPVNSSVNQKWRANFVAGFHSGSTRQNGRRFGLQFLRTQFSPFSRTPVHGVDSFLPCQSMGHAGDAANKWLRSGQAQEM